MLSIESRTPTPNRPKAYRPRRLDTQLRAYILHCLCEGMSQRSCERVFGVSNKTVAKLFEEAGDMAIEYVRSLRDLTPARIQADEIFAFVGAKEKNLPKTRLSECEAGTFYGYLAMCADTKLIFSYHLGDRDTPDATKFAKDMVSKLKRKANGELAVKPLIVTDGLPAYNEAFDLAFGDEANRAMLIKKYETTEREGKRSRRRYVGADREVRVGTADRADIHTGYIERQNCNLRMGNRRYNRKTNAFSKTPLNHERHLALWIMYHNLCWVPCPVRPEPNEFGMRSGQWRKRLPASMEAGIADRIFEIRDLLDLTDEFTENRKAQALVPKPEPAVEAPQSPRKATHWVYQSFSKRTTKVHAASCSSCNHGQGKKKGSSAEGRWLSFSSQDEATTEAKALEPDRYSTCRMCLEDQHVLGYRHAGSSRQAGNPSHFI